ncbi:hypothetical protein BD770DRAFT_402009 [Pilaira anomala]|nr:hypothetical protein BD770DRAFT_402009 [Pilaira anomala]
MANINGHPPSQQAEVLSNLKLKPFLSSSIVMNMVVDFIIGPHAQHQYTPALDQNISEVLYLPIPQDTYHFPPILIKVRDTVDNDYIISLMSQTISVYQKYEKKTPIVITFVRSTINEEILTKITNLKDTNGILNYPCNPWGRACYFVNNNIVPANNINVTMHAFVALSTFLIKQHPSLLEDPHRANPTMQILHSLAARILLDQITESENNVKDLMLVCQNADNTFAKAIATLSEEIPDVRKWSRTKKILEEGRQAPQAYKRKFEAMASASSRIRSNGYSTPFAASQHSTNTTGTTAAPNPRTVASTSASTSTNVNISANSSNNAAAKSNTNTKTTGNNKTYARLISEIHTKLSNTRNTTNINAVNSTANVSSPRNILPRERAGVQREASPVPRRYNPKIDKAKTKAKATNPFIQPRNNEPSFAPHDKSFLELTNMINKSRKPSATTSTNTAAANIKANPVAETKLSTISNLEANVVTNNTNASTNSSSNSGDSSAASGSMPSVPPDWAFVEKYLSDLEEKNDAKICWYRMFKDGKDIGLFSNYVHYNRMKVAYYKWKDQQN